MFHLREPYDPPIVTKRRRRAAVASVRTGAVRVGASAGDIAAELAGLTTTDDIDAVYRRHLKSGDVPSYIATEGWWPGKVIITGGGHTLEILSIPDYGAIGSADDPYRIGKSSEKFAQEYADAFDSILVSQKLLRDIEAAADPKFPFMPVQKGGGADDSIDAVGTANDKARAAFEKAGVTPGSRNTIGYRKSYVVRPNLDGTYLAIYGGRWSAAGGLVQPTSGHAHTEGYADYSHGLTLVSRKAKLDGEDVDLRDLFNSKDPTILALVSDEGRFDPVFPNAGAGSRATFSTEGDEEGSEEYGVPGEEKPAKVVYKVEPSVMSVQRALVDLGYDVGAGGADGKSGPDTLAAIDKFRSEHGLPAGGIDSALTDALQEEISKKLPAASAAGGYATPLAIGFAALVAIGLVWWLV